MMARLILRRLLGWIRAWGPTVGTMGLNLVGTLVGKNKRRRKINLIRRLWEVDRAARQESQRYLLELQMTEITARQRREDIQGFAADAAEEKRRAAYDAIEKMRADCESNPSAFAGTIDTYSRGGKSHH